MSNDISRDLETIVELIKTLGRQRSLRDPLSNAWEEYNFSPPQLHTIMWLGSDGAITMGDLARRCGISDKTVTGVIDRLERDKYVARERDPSDRRVVRVHLTAKGQKTYKQLDSEVRHKMELLLRRLEADDRAALIRILQRLATAPDAAKPLPRETA